MRRMTHVVLPLLLLLSGCAHVLSQEALQQVDPLLDYAQVKADPEAHRGKILLLGGMIVDLRVGSGQTDLEVLRYRLDRWGTPVEADETSGRFIARTSRFLDPGLYGRGQFITLTGTVEGSESRAVQGYEYRYPVLRIVEAYIRNQPIPAYYPPYHPYYDPYAPWRPYPAAVYPDPFWPYAPYPGYPYWYQPPGRRLK